MRMRHFSSEKENKNVGRCWTAETKAVNKNANGSAAHYDTPITSYRDRVWMDSIENPGNNEYTMQAEVYCIVFFFRWFAYKLLLFPFVSSSNCESVCEWVLVLD